MKDGTAISLYNAFVVTNIVPKLNITWNKIGLFKQFIFKGAHQNCSVSVNVLFYLTIIVLFKTLVDVYLCSYGVLRFHVCFWTINPTYFQCKYEGKYKLIVNIVNWTFPAQTAKILNVWANTLTSVDIKHEQCTCYSCVFNERSMTFRFPFVLHRNLQNIYLTNKYRFHVY